jgi:F0F1-type ATP synthase membrane subunit b/b'
VSPELANFLFEAANFLLLAAVLGWLLFRPVRRIIDAERARHEQQTTEIASLRAQTQKLADETRETRQSAERELEARRRALLEDARKEAARILEEAKSAEHARRQKLAQELAAARKTETAALADAVGRLAAEAVRALLAQLDGPSLDDALVRAACAQLDGVATDTGKRARVESARALSPEGRALLETALGTGFEERVVEELGAGVRITTPSGQVDATAVAIARRAGVAVSALGTSADGEPGPEDGADG